MRRRIKLLSFAIISLFFSVTTLQAQSQNSLWLEKGKDNTLLVAEFKDSHPRHFNYLYVESELGSTETKSVYVLFSRDQKFWDKNIWIHGEFRTFAAFEEKVNTIFLLGPMFTLMDNKTGFVNLQTMYRYDGKSNAQVSLLSDLTYKRLYYTMFADFYGTDKLYMHSENRLFFNVYKCINIGCNVILMLNETEKQFKVKPLAVLRIDL